MKLLFDENVSPRLPHRLAGEFPGSTHVRGVGLRGADLGLRARNEGFAIVSKDADFRERSYVEGAPPKIVWLDVGNAGTEVSRGCCGVSASGSSASRRQKNRLS